jgi:molybdenum cofactor biosynthesis enzyme MoaA
MINNNSYIPPLRFILTHKCNGQCYYCHKEGNADKYNDMSLDVIERSLDTVIGLNISRISLTGGEPTMHEKIEDIIKLIKSKKTNTQLGITTNGCNMGVLVKLLEEDTNLLNLINISVHSFDKRIYSQYTAVEPSSIFDVLKNLVRKCKVVINIVIGKNNINEFSNIANFYLKEGFSVDLMPVLDTSYSDQKLLYSKLHQFINSRNFTSIQLGSTPMLYEQHDRNVILRIKDPSLSCIISRKICRNCPENKTCGEQVCAVRVYANQTVSPCLNNKILFDKPDVYENIIDAYNKINDFSLNLGYYNVRLNKTMNHQSGIKE